MYRRNPNGFSCVICSMYKLLLALSCMALITACSPGDDEEYTPKPRGYFRINLPAKKYQRFSQGYPYSFDYADNAIVKPDSSRLTEPYWLNIDYPQLNARIYISYKPINATNNLKTLLEDTRTLVYKHTVRADDIAERAFADDEKKVYGTLYSIAGNAASSAQFFVTDSTRHYVRGALYFNCPPNADSLAPVIDYVRQDIAKMIESLTWK